MVWDLTIAALVALACSFAVCQALIGAPIVDMPDAPRKAHRAPTPTSGGIAMALGFAVALFALGAISTVWRHTIELLSATRATWAAVLAYAFLFLGFLDDAYPLGPRLKFLVFGALSVATALLIGVVGELPIGDMRLVLPYPIALLGTALWVFTLVNCVNFMDGANGLAMGSVAIGLIVVAIIAVNIGGLGAAAISACGAGALLGFLLWNFPGGRLFAGDSGALFAGALGAVVSLSLIARGDLSPFVPPIIFFPLLADALLTLAWRARRGRSLLDGHSEHLYQIAQRAGWGRRRIAVIYWAAMALCGAIGVAAVWSGDPLFAPLALAALAVLAVVLSRIVRSAAKKRGIAEI
ncbi:MAG TPA: MraY family glycosyltransferase [Terricaulis sp.]|nr:MraY family glycosyltransferase [Terricaulis sp.]